jgi:autotransporter translocation and assembly factor TamB
MKLARLVLILLVAVGVVFGALAVALHTAAVRGVIASRVTAALGAALDQQVAVGTMEGDWPNQIILTGVSLSDAGGPWLTIDRMDLRWNAFALLRRRVEIDDLQAGTVRVLRLPASSQTQAPAPRLNDIRAALDRAYIGNFAVQALQLDAAVLGRPGTVALTASLRADTGPQTLALALERKDAPGSAVFALKLPPGAFNLDTRAAIAGVTLNGALALDQTSSALSGSLHLTCGDGAPCLTWPAGQFGAVTADTTMAGTLAAPQATATLHLSDLRDDGRTLKTFDGKVVVTPDETNGIAARGEGAVTGLKAGVSEVADVLSDDGTWTFDGQWTGERFAVRSAALKSGDTALTVAGVVENGVFSDVTGTLTLPKAGRLLGIADANSATRLDLAFDRLAFSPFAAAGRLTAVIDNAPPGISLAPAAAGTLRLTSAAVFDSRHFSLDGVTGSFGKTAFHGASSWTRGPNGLDHAATTLTATVAAGALAGFPEAVAVEGRLTGGLKSLSAELSAKTNGVALAGSPVTEAVAKVTARREQRLWQGDLHLDGRWRETPVGVTAAFVQESTSVFALSAVHGTALAANLDGALSVNIETGMVTGGLAGKVPDLGPLTTLAGLPASGAGELGAAFTASNGQRFTLSLSAARVTGETLSAESLTTQAVIDDAWRTPKLTLRVKATDGALWGRSFAETTVAADGSFAALAVQAKGAGVHKFSFATSGTVSIGPGIDIAISRLTLEDGDVTVRLLAPTRFAYSAAAITLAPTRLAANGGTVAGAFILDRRNNKVEGTAELAKIVFGETSANLPGAARTMVDGTLKISGDAAAADADMSLAAHYTAKESGGIDVTAKLAATLRKGRAVLTGSAAGLSAEDAKLAADIPVRADLIARRLAFDMNAPMSGNLTWHGEVKPLWQVLALDQHLLSGQADVDVSARGTFDQPIIKGGLGLTKGRYENLISGTALQGLDAAVTAGSGASMAIKLAATDTANGRVTAQGAMVWDNTHKGWTVDASGDLAAFHVLRRDDVTAAATGHLTYKGPLTTGTLSGRLQVVRSEMRIGASYVPEIPLLRAKSLGEPVVPGRPSTLQLDITLAIDDVLRIEGKGLEAFWRGDLRAQGNMDAPDVSGTLTLARGTFTFLGRSFDLDTGSVTFTGGGKIDPELALSASRVSGDVTATVAISGRASQPRIALSSVPVLPQDEVLAQLLFRKGATELGPLESLQLASAAADLAGLAQGGLSGLLRRTFGLDIVGFGGKSGDAVVLGRQFSSSIYVGVEQSVGSTSDHQIVVEWRLNRSIAVQSTTSPQTGADLGLIWRKNY